MSDTQAEQERQAQPPPADQAGQEAAAAPRQPDLLAMLSGLLGGKGGQAGQAGAVVAKLAPAVMGMVSAQGGVGGLLEKLKQGGLGDQVKSWVSPQEKNAPVSGEQVSDALGREQVDALAAQAGVSPQEAADGMAKVLPGAVDQLTPEGEVPKEHQGFDIDQVKQQVARLLGANR
ncbi:DUF937 domain-containing protein [Actinospica durhamensis]|uniref:DUF937 domain-containing protein n=1 Tax=Actinospica durhamensis TaxID=1508375 RepID=A0A941EXY0_9ACTN|nr:YidB family protein [Actinospica durhamensis]MBR7838458.1 DUF937 domain-containing protein [Actinospica durhamensis]